MEEQGWGTISILRADRHSQTRQGSNEPHETGALLAITDPILSHAGLPADSALSPHLDGLALRLPSAGRVLLGGQLQGRQLLLQPRHVLLQRADVHATPGDGVHLQRGTSGAALTGGQGLVVHSTQQWRRNSRSTYLMV